MTVTLYRSGPVHAPGSPRASALLADSSTGEIVWVGTDEAAAGLDDPDVEVDLHGRLMVPAFVDAWTSAGATGSGRTAVARGVGCLHVLAPPEASDGGPSVAPVPAPGPEVRRFAAVEADAVDRASLTERYEQATRAGEQAVVVLRDPRSVALVLAAAGAAAQRTGLPRFVATRHRLHLFDGPPVDAVPELARLGLVLCFGAGNDGVGRPYRALAAAGVALAFGSAGGEIDPWRWVREATSGPHAISARAAFAAATRGGHRAARADDAGLLRPGAPATFAVWDVTGELVVRTPDARIAAWSTDPRAATPGLPDLEQAPAPRCCRTVVHGRTVFDGD